MRRFIIIAGLVGGLATLAITAKSQSLRAFGHWGQYWGTWVWQTQFGPGVALPALITLHIDGTVAGSDGTMFGGTPNSTTRTTPLHGVWERTSAQSIGGTSLYLVYNAATGVLMAYGRARTSLQFADDFDHFQGKMFVETLPCPGPTSCPDPLDPAAKWVAFSGMPADGFPVTATRLERVPAAALTQ